MYYADPQQLVATANEELDDVHHDPSEVRSVWYPGSQSVYNMHLTKHTLAG